LVFDFHTVWKAVLKEQDKKISRWLKFYSTPHVVMINHHRMTNGIVLGKKRHQSRSESPRSFWKWLSQLQAHHLPPPPWAFVRHLCFFLFENMMLQMSTLGLEYLRRSPRWCFETTVKMSYPAKKQGSI